MRDESFLNEHVSLTRRLFLTCGAIAVSVTARRSDAAADDHRRNGDEATDSDCGFSTDEASPQAVPARKSAAPRKEDKSGVQQDPYFTPADDFRDVSRGKPIPHSLSEDQRREVGLTRETWQLEVISDPDNPAKLGKPMSKADGTAFDFAALIKLGEQHAVRFAKLMTCLNLGCPLGMGLWEGVPLREVIWLTQPRENLRRVFYYGFHNHDPKQMFRSSLPIGRVLEDPYDLPPVILCYKLNGQWLDPERGGPVRIVVPEAYGFKSVKWLSHIMLTNLAHANDTYAEQNNDVDSPLKTFAATLSIPDAIQAGHAFPVTGYAQVGISGLAGVQVSIEPKDKEPDSSDPYFTRSVWHDAELIPRPQHWGAIDDGQVPAGTLGFTDGGEPIHWPMRLSKVHWSAQIAGMAAGDYTLRCRAIDEKGHAQPMPRPFRKSGHAAIESVSIRIT